MNSEHYDCDKVARARKSLGTQIEVSNLVGVTVTQLSRAENGKSASYELLYEIAKLAGVNVSDFLKDTAKVKNN